MLILLLYCIVFYLFIYVYVSLNFREHPYSPMQYSPNVHFYVLKNAFGENRIGE